MPRRFFPSIFFLVGVLFLSLAAWADNVALSLTSTRMNFSVAEPVEIAVLYANTDGDLKTVPVMITHADGSAFSLTVPVSATRGESVSRLVTMNAGALKPGRYTITTTNADSQVVFSVFPAEHPNAFFVGQWVHHGETPGTILAKGGWMYMNSDLATLHPRQPKTGDLAESYVAASMKPFSRMVLGGGHQLDLDLENDWGDPWVQRAVIWRMQLAALSNRLYPIAGSHCYDEPGLTHWPIKDADGKVTGMNPFAIPYQLDEFTRLTGKSMPYGSFDDVCREYAKDEDAFLAFMDMRMQYLEQCWYGTVYGTDSVVPQFTTINQVSSSYAPGDITDGVDVRQNRPYRVVCGHGGYSDQPYGGMQPVRSMEAMRGFGWDKPHYYLPMWYSHSWGSIRNSVWMSWASKLEGMLYTPDMDFELNNDLGMAKWQNPTIFEIAEVNRRLAMVGGVMNQLPKTLSPVAILMSARQMAKDIADGNADGPIPDIPPMYYSPHRSAVDQTFFRVMETGMIPNWIEEVEVTEKGAAFLQQWKVIYCPRLSTLTPTMRTALETYIANGGKFVQMKGDALLLNGAIVADYDFGSWEEYWNTRLREKPPTNEGTDLAIRKWNMDFAPTFAKDLAGWLGEMFYRSSNTDVILAAHKAGTATYLLMANNMQDATNPRGVKHEFIPADTQVTFPAGGVVYDLFNGGAVAVQNDKASLKLAAGDGACWLHLPSPPGAMKVAANLKGDNVLQISLNWGTVGYLPFRLRIFDPAGKKVADLFRATTPRAKDTYFSIEYPLGLNAQPGAWNVEVSEWLTGSTATARATVRAAATGEWAKQNTRPESIYFDDAARIIDLFAGKSFAPDFTKLNYDAERVMKVDPTRFAVFGPDDAAVKIAGALRAKGYSVEVNPAFELKPFVREPRRGGSGPSHGATSNYENIFANTIVLPEHRLGQLASQRGHINRPVTDAFPGPGRAYIQWGVSCFQPGWQNVFAFGDVDVVVDWLLQAINGKAPDVTQDIKVTAKPGAGIAKALPALQVTLETRTFDTPVALAVHPDLANGTNYVLLYDGTVIALGTNGKPLWSVKALLEGQALSVSPKGDRLAVAGFPGVQVLDARDGKILGGEQAAPIPGYIGVGYSNTMVDVAWNSAGTLAAGCWRNIYVNEKDGRAALPVFIVDAQGKRLATPAGDYLNVMGVAFIPGTDTLLIGAETLTAVNGRDGRVLWSNDIKNAQAFAFSADGKAAAGGYGLTVGVFDAATGAIAYQAKVPSVVGGLSFLPGGDIAAAVWGGTHPLQRIRAGATTAEVLFQSSFGFQSCAWSRALNGLVATEQGGKIWLLAEDGSPKAMLDEEAGTTAYRMALSGSQILVARMNRLVQRVELKR